MLSYCIVAVMRVVVALIAIVSATGAFTPFAMRRGSGGTSSTSSTPLFMSSALIVQNKGGGHGELGYQLAKTLSSNDKITSITILQDDACKDDAEPFKSYASNLLDVKVVKAPLSSDDHSMTADTIQELLGGPDVRFDYVWDNASKSPTGAGKAMCDAAKKWGVKLYTYVSSAGMYKPAPDAVFPMDEDTTPIKESAGQAQFDKYAAEECGLPLVSFRPQYIYGEKANKHDYIDWYFDRLVRKGLPLPIPNDGTQKLSLTNSKDVAEILVSPLNNEEAAIKQRFFNCGTDKLYTYDEVAYMCAEAAGVAKEDVLIHHYDAGLFGKAYFPFRLTDFYVTPDKAKELLGYEGAKCDLQEDLNNWYFENYKERGGPTKKMSLVLDWEITVGSKTRTTPYSIYDDYDPIPIDTSNVKPLIIDESLITPSE